MKILIMGNPNVGKSAIFSRLTGVDVMISNYPGTTIELKKRKMKLEERLAEVVDVPGTYSLEPASKAEEVAVNMLKEGDMVINVVDATNMERNLNITLQLLEQNIPVIVASVILTMYFPCIATFVILFKELGVRDLIKATAIMIVSTLLVGGVLNALL